MHRQLSLYILRNHIAGDSMKKTILLSTALLISVSAFSFTTSQKIAKEMTAVLESKEVQTLLSNDDGVGNIEGIKYLFSYRASFGPAIYELSFRSHSGPVVQVCTVPVHVNTETVQVLKMGSADCKEL
jgi:hypothetical protein